MTYLKIENIQGEFGSIDYKGLDIDKFVAGSQLYAQDFNSVHVLTNENLEGWTLPKDVTIITKEEYDVYKANMPKPVEPLDWDAEIRALKATQKEQDEMIMSLLLGGL